MRTMYIILSCIGWGWLLIAGSFLSVVLYRQRQQGRPDGFPVTPVDPIGVEADVRP
jgi:hypothetical protein